MKTTSQKIKDIRAPYYFFNPVTLKAQALNFEVCFDFQLPASPPTPSPLFDAVQASNYAVVIS